MKKIISTLIAILLLTTACFAAESIFWGFDDENLSSSMRPNFSWTSSGIMTATDLNTTDPFITYNCNLKADDYDKVIIRMKYDLIAREDNKEANCQVYYTGTDASGAAISLSEGNSVKVPLGSLSTNGEYKTYVLPLDKANLKGATIKSLRFDIVNCKGSFGIDYIMISARNPHPDYVYDFNINGNAEGWGYANLTSACTIENGALTGTNKASNGLIDKDFGTLLYGGDYPKIYVRMKTSGLTTDAHALIYTDLYDKNGNPLKESWWTSYGDYKNITLRHQAANDGKWVLHTFNLSSTNSYMNNYFKYMVLNNVNVEGVSFAVDYVILKNINNYEWTFDHEDFHEGWSQPSGFSIKDGDMVFTCGSTYSNPMFRLDNQKIDADKYDGIEIIMKHNLKPDGDKPADTNTDVQLYYYGTAADGSVVGWAEANSSKTAITSQSSGDSYVYYYIDLASKKTWKGSTITSLRIDPLNSNGDAAISYIRLVPNENATSNPLDESLISVKYEFEDEISGNADGTFTVDLGNQNFDDIKKLTLSWADENGNALSDYSIIRAFTSGEFKGTYTINKNLLIPQNAVKLIAEFTDTDKSFDFLIDIPQEKLPKNPGEPLYTVALISDIHIGGWGSETEPNARLTAARKQINEYADFVVINGDLTQWYGAYSGQEFNAFNYNGSSFKDNGETDTSILDKKLGTSQWEVLRSYFEGFDVPVYPVQGNHDIRDGDKWSTVYYNPSYWLDTFHSWLDDSNAGANNANKYQNPVTYYDNHNYYDAEIYGNHFIFLELPKIQGPYYAMGDEQLAWLDKKLYEKEATGKPIFVFTHVPTESVVNASYWDDQIDDDAKFKAVLSKHPTAIVVSGHTHYSLDIDTYSSYNGAQSEYSVIHNGGTTTINVPNGTDYLDTTEISGSHGVFAEVYEDKILLRGRDFVADKWISKGYTLITLKEAPDFEIKAVRTTDESGNITLSAENVNKDYSYTWIIDGVVTNDTTVTIADNVDYAALRVTTNNGVFATELFDDIALIPDKESAFLEIKDGIVTVKGVDEQSYLIICSYIGKRLNDAYILPVASDCEINVDETTLDTDGCTKVTAILLRKSSLSPIFPASSQ